MRVSDAEMEFISYIMELMQPIGSISTKRMFGCHGIFLNGLMFGLVSDSILYLKTDATIASEFRDKGLEVFTYNKKGKEIKMSYYQAPEEILEDNEKMIIWAKKSYNVALKA